jgi:hypothetical protein
MWAGCSISGSFYLYVAVFCVTVNHDSPLRFTCRCINDIPRVKIRQERKVDVPDKRLRRIAGC